MWDRFAAKSGSAGCLGITTARPRDASDETAKNRQWEIIYQCEMDCCCSDYSSTLGWGKAGADRPVRLSDYERDLSDEE